MATIGTNIAAISAANFLTENDQALTESIQKLSSGSRLANPVDDAAGVAVSGNLEARIDRLNAAVNGVQDAVSYGQTVDGYLSTLQAIVTRLSELTQEMTNGSFSTSDRNDYLTEANVIAAQFSSIVSNANFDGISVFSGAASASNLTVTVDSLGTTDSLNTSGVAGVITSLIQSVIGFFSGATANVLTDFTTTNAGSYIASVNNAITSLTTSRAIINADISKFNFYISNIQTETVNVQSANSRISDLNVAQESTNESKQSILVQAATAMLSQANTSQSSIIQLLR